MARCLRGVRHYGASVARQSMDWRLACRARNRHSDRMTLPRRFFTRSDATQSMSARAIATIVATMGLLLATAPLSSAAANDPNLTWRSKYSCAATYTNGTRGGLWVRAISDTSRRTATVEYSMWGFDGPRHSALNMPIGTGKIMVLRHEHITPGGDGGFLAERPGPPDSRRYRCQDPLSGAHDVTSDIVYIQPPAKPTVADVEAYCAKFARENPDHSEAPACVPVLINNLRL
jgi:hypothetical protein